MIFKALSKPNLWSPPPYSYPRGEEGEEALTPLQRDRDSSGEWPQSSWNVGKTACDPASCEQKGLVSTEGMGVPLAGLDRISVVIFIYWFRFISNFSNILCPRGWTPLLFLASYSTCHLQITCTSRTFSVYSYHKFTRLVGIMCSLFSSNFKSEDLQTSKIFGF